jgi:hypothetical protein
MRLYPRGDVGAVDDPEFGHFEPGDDGGFDLPGPLSDRLHGAHIRGEQQWEDQIERQRRLIQEEAARRADPRTLLEAVEKIQRLAENAQPEPEPAKSRAKASAKS